MPHGYLRLDSPHRRPRYAPPPSALAVVRATGPGSPELAGPRLLPPRGPGPGGGIPASCTAGYGTRTRVGTWTRWWPWSSGRPESYTGQDSVDLVCHGSPAALGRQSFPPWSGSGSSAPCRGSSPSAPLRPARWTWPPRRPWTSWSAPERGKPATGPWNACPAAWAARSGSLRDSVLEALSEAEARLDYAEDELAGRPGGSAGSGGGRPGPRRAPGGQPRRRPHPFRRRPRGPGRPHERREVAALQPLPEGGTLHSIGVPRHDARLYRGRPWTWTESR